MLVISFRESATTRGFDLARSEDEHAETSNVHVETGHGVDFTGELNGTVAVRCTAEGAMDLARGLLMPEEGETVALEEIEDALGECANLLAGALKTKALDPVGSFKLGLPYKLDNWGNDGRAVAYNLTKGAVSVEIRLSESTTDGDQES